MSDVVGTPTDELGGLSLYQADHDLPDYVSSVGSSVYQSKKTTVEVDAEMVNNAMLMITNLQQQVLSFLLISILELTNIFFRLLLCSSRWLLVLFQLRWKVLKSWSRSSNPR